jgi:prolyl-tRNA synthetase
MKDAYSFDLDYDGAVVSYRTMMLAYMRTFQRIGLKAIPMEAESGPIGGELSHEFIILAPTGESQVYYDADFENIDWVNAHFDYNAKDLEAFFKQMTSMYAATDEKHNPAKWALVDQARRREGRGIEVGHIFHFGSKYTKAMNVTVTAPDGRKVNPEMGSYGVGVSRLVGAVIEASHDEAGIIWPDAVAPFSAAILNLRRGDAACDALCEGLYAKLGPAALYDDREERAGAKFADADLMGHPWQIIVGPRGAAAGKVELKRRATGERSEVSPDEALEIIRRPRESGGQGAGSPPSRG